MPSTCDFVVGVTRFELVASSVSVPYRLLLGYDGYDSQ